MPRPMLRPQSATTSNTLSVKPQINSKQSTNAATDKMLLERVMHKQRSKRYVELMRSLDAGGHVCNKNQVDEIINAIREEFPEVELDGVMLGIISQCYLGAPYEVHVLDFTGGIIDHYKAGHPLPLGMEKARTLAMRGGYEFIEVYINYCVAVDLSGRSSVIQM